MIFRNKLKNKFSILPNSAIEDLRLHPIAFRMLAYLFSRPANWEVNNSDISKKIGIKDPKTLAKYWKQLEQTGWILRKKKKSKDGTFAGGFNYELTESPYYPNMDTVLNRIPSTLGQNGGLNNTDSNTNTDNSNNTKEHIPSFIKKISSKTVKLLLSNTTYQSLEPEKQELFVNWVKNRKEINKPLKTKRMIEGQIKHFVKYHPKEIKDAVELASEKGWVDIKYAFDTKPTVADNLQVPYYAQAKR